MHTLTQPIMCSFDCRIAFYPGVSARDAANEIEACIARLDGGTL